MKMFNWLPQCLSRLFGRFVADRKGVTTMEFALVIPVMSFMTIGIFEVGMIMFVNSLIEGGVREAARFGITGNTPPGVTREAQLRNIIGAKTLGLVDLDQSKITTLVYPSFDSVGLPEPYTDQNDSGVYEEGEPYSDINGNGQWDPDMGAAGLGGPGEVVLYRIEMDWGSMTGLIDPIFGNDGLLPLTASVVVRNEPFADN